MTGIIVNITPSRRYCEIETPAGPRMFLARQLKPTTPELVAPDRSCTCGERRMDWLVWTDDAINVKCATCGAIFRPGAGA